MSATTGPPFTDLASFADFRDPMTKREVGAKQSQSGKNTGARRPVFTADPIILARTSSPMCCSRSTSSRPMTGEARAPSDLTHRPQHPRGGSYRCELLGSRMAVLTGLVKLDKTM